MKSAFDGFAQDLLNRFGVVRDDCRTDPPTHIKRNRNPFAAATTFPRKLVARPTEAQSDETMPSRPESHLEDFDLTDLSETRYVWRRSASDSF